MPLVMTEPTQAPARTAATRPILVFGGGGFVGTALVRLLENSAGVVAPPSAEVDVRDEAALRACIADVDPGAVINLAAVNPGQGDDERMTRVNVEGAAAVAAASGGRRLVHVSSDMVLDGLDAPYLDDAVAAPTQHYGRTKALGEQCVLAVHENAVVVRTSLVFDPALMDRGTRAFAERLARAEPCRLFVDERRSVVCRTQLVAALAELTEHPVRGLLNVAGADGVTRYEYGVALLEHFDVPGRETVETARARELAPHRPPDLTLDIGRASALLRTPLRSFHETLAAGGG